MCLTLTAKQCVPHIAEEDIICDKVVYKPRLKDFLISPYRGYIYLNVKYHVSITLTAKITPISATPWRIPDKTNKFAIYEGIHALVHRTDRFRPKAKWGPIIIPAIIPKGTVYYTDGCDIVAEKMIIYNPFTIRN
jgi:hypothetical protein